MKNAKNKDFNVPVNIPGTKPEEYTSTISSGNGSAAPVKNSRTRDTVATGMSADTR